MAVCDAPMGKSSGETVPCVAAEILNQQLAQEGKLGLACSLGLSA